MPNLGNRTCDTIRVMKIFVVYAKVELVEKPDWLDNFRSLYDKPYEFHVTLKQSSLVEDDKVADIKNKLDGLFSKLNIPNHEIILTFNSLNVHKDALQDICIMIDAEPNPEINKLQSNIIETLKDYKQYFKLKYEEYEKNFQPHITIGRELKQGDYEKASEKLTQDYTCKGVIKEVVLVVTQNKDVTEANNPNNQTIYKL